MEEYARTLRRSGYSERFRHEVISDAMRCHQKRLKTEAEGGRPVDRSRAYKPQERRTRREEKRERFYRKEPRGSRVREGLLIIPPTPNSVLAKELKQVCREELKGSNISIQVQERGGRTLGQELGVKIPGMSNKESCRRENCFPCNTGNEGVCRRTGVGYEINCEVCGQKNLESKYAG